MRKVHRYQGVQGVTGLPGAGKTYLLAELGLAAMDRGEPVYCNAGFDLAGATRLKSFREFAEVEGPGLIVWDELPLYFNARRWDKMPDGMLYKFTQIRKDGLRLVYSTMHENMVDVTLRRITWSWWYCRMGRFGTFRRELWLPEEYRRDKERPLAVDLARPKQRVLDAYDTFAKVEVADGMKGATGDERLDVQFAKPAWATQGNGGGPGAAPEGARPAPENGKHSRAEGVDGGAIP